MLSLNMIDANVALRYLLRDNEEQAQQAREAIMQGAGIRLEVIAEVVYVLAGVYGLSRPEIDTAVENLLDDAATFDEEVVRAALRMYALSNLDFIDCTLVARNLLQDEQIHTFDKKLLRYLR